jgi:hypothetical protein
MLEIFIRRKGLKFNDLSAFVHSLYNTKLNAKYVIKQKSQNYDYKLQVK